jgi:hypothetical protein
VCHFHVLSSTQQLPDILPDPLPIYQNDYSRKIHYIHFYSLSNTANYHPNDLSPISHVIPIIKMTAFPKSPHEKKRQDTGPQRVAVRAFPATGRLAPPHAALAALLLTAFAVFSSGRAIWLKWWRLILKKNDY